LNLFELVCTWLSILVRTNVLRAPIIGARDTAAIIGIQTAVKKRSIGAALWCFGRSDVDDASGSLRSGTIRMTIPLLVRTRQDMLWLLDLVMDRSDEGSTMSTAPRDPEFVKQRRRIPQVCARQWSPTVDEVCSKNWFVHSRPSNCILELIGIFLRSIPMVYSRPAHTKLAITVRTVV
jgi:hypothetical protein